MDKTTHYGLNLPRPEDYYRVEDFNENAVALDGALYDLRQSIQPRQKELVATFTESGLFYPGDLGLSGARVDVYIVGAGGGGAVDSPLGGGGGGGYCRLLRNLNLAASFYTIIIGAGGAPGSNGGATDAFYTTCGGGRTPNLSGLAANAYYDRCIGGEGGSGGGGGRYKRTVNNIPTIELPCGDGGWGGGGGGGNGGDGWGNINYCPVNPYDHIAYGCGGGGGDTGCGGGAGGVGWCVDATALPSTRRNGYLGGGGGGGSGGSGGDGIVYIYA